MTQKNQSASYETFADLFSKGYRSERFQAAYDPASFRTDKPLSERLLFTQSNARVLLGQDSGGGLAFVAAPHERDYAIPTCVTDGSRYPVTAQPGMFYQTDMAMWLGRAQYTLLLDDGRAYTGAEERSQTWYLDHFLPVTRTERDGLVMHLVSLAPTLEAPTDQGISGTPLPGPSGALYALHVYNGSATAIHGRCELSFRRDFVIRSEYDGEHFFEEDVVAPYHCEWEREIYTMWRPDACASVHFEGATPGGTVEAPTPYLAFDLAPGEAQVFTTRVAVAPTKEGIMPALATLFQHDVLAWIRYTRAFWEERLGEWNCTIAGDTEGLSTAYRDFQLRSILDNFNCLQTDAHGRLLVHWQGAPSHNIGRFWGIDIEPTALSVLYAVPELGPSLLVYLSERNEPRYSDYTDHSTPIRVALLTIAGQYLRLTNDVAYFERNPALLSAMDATYTRLMASKHDTYALFSSRYSSDGIVFHRYDLGTNAKAFFALKGYRQVLMALGQAARAEEIQALMEAMRRDLRQTMIQEGPYGPQWTGGESFGEEPDFYFREDMFYYDGEDSSSCLIPVYGLFGFDDEAWKNYHRYARTLFVPNYDAEMGALRWFFYGGAVDGTAYVSRLGGCVTREEMRTALVGMLDNSVDLTGSLYWWPKARNKRRCIARCSQGQGSWVYQGTEQWLGLQMDATTQTLTVRPQGVLSAYHWRHARLGRYVFDVEWAENDCGTEVALQNHNGVAIKVRLGIRPQRCGSDGLLRWEEVTVQPGERLVRQYPYDDGAPEATMDLADALLSRHGRDGCVFGTFGLQMPSVEQKTNAFLLRYAMLAEGDVADAQVRVTVPAGWGIQAKAPCLWDTLPTHIEERSATVRFPTVDKRTEVVFPFYVCLPDGMDARHVWRSEHPFEFPEGGRQENILYVRSDAAFEGAIEVSLQYVTGKGEQKARSETLAVQGLDASAFQAMVRRQLHQVR